MALCEEQKLPQTSSGRAGLFPGAVGAGGRGGHLEGAEGGAGGRPRGGVAGVSDHRPPGWSPLRGSADGGDEHTMLVWVSSVPPDRSPRGRGVTVQTWGEAPPRESERRGRAHRRARAGSLLASYQWGGGGRLWAWPGLQSSWSCAPLPGGVCPLSSPRWSVRVSSAFSSSHLLCTWLRCQQSTFGTNQSFCLGLGEAQGGSIWEPLPSFRSGDQPGSEPHQAGDMVTSPLPAQGQCRFGQSV